MELCIMCGIFGCVGLGWVGFRWARTEVHSFEPNQFRIISTQDSYAVPFSLCVRVCALSFVASS